MGMECRADVARMQTWEEVGLDLKETTYSSDNASISVYKGSGSSIIRKAR